MESAQINLTLSPLLRISSAMGQYRQFGVSESTLLRLSTIRKGMGTPQGTKLTDAIQKELLEEWDFGTPSKLRSIVCQA